MQYAACIELIQETPKGKKKNKEHFPTLSLSELISCGVRSIGYASWC